MINTTQDLVKLLESTPLGGRKIVKLPILDTEEVAFAIKTNPKQIEANWRVARALLPQTGRWPLITTTHSAENAGSLQANLLEADFFSRFYYEEAPQFEKNPDPEIITPKALRMQADTADYLPAFQAYIQERDGDYPLDLYMDTIAQDCRDRVGTPKRKEINAAHDSGKFKTYYDNERWLDRWEQAQGYTHDVQEARQDWYEPESTVMLFLPTSNGWDALAYLNWYGTSDIGSEYYIALGRSWEKRFGAELVAHYGTILQCVVSRPPQSLDEAWPLACEHDMSSESTLALSGIHLRDYAHALIGWNRWFLHERP